MRKASTVTAGDRVVTEVVNHLRGHKLVTVNRPGSFTLRLAHVLTSLDADGHAVYAGGGYTTGAQLWSVDPAQDSFALCPECE